MTVESVLPAPPVPQWFADLFAHRRWVRRNKPFPHVYARDVFVPEFYQRLADEFFRVQRERPDDFGKVGENYSATGISLGALRNGPLALFISREWHDLIAKVAGISVTGDMDGSLHHHPPGSPYGWPHNDLNPAWFPGDPPGPNEVKLADSSVAIKNGTRAPGVTARETVRAVAVLFYLANPDWQPGDGGETALYEHIGDGTTTPTLVPPLDNSLVMFECTPRSWHTYAGNNRHQRNSVVMWLHRPKDDVVQRWGEDRIEYW
ncbi:2OG-Fe(II) oxygenase family protein [Nocardia arthritidis]|uniref:2OG-Fe(II) oxygenase n=1 Tax=Nocardia arthritidis TaxID=228602 RepID=A0A6G9YVB2_9NOCA|nr:2OG-Fe(II) oxygenase [Nocardia arthritidis]QIS16773.1 2OG-Fe(II) oxygenase [Nocardia arthritidis]